MKISIVTPTFNSEKYLQETLDSVQNQRGNFDLEHIVVDAGSTDSTLEILTKNPMVSVLNYPKSSMYEAIDLGFRNAKGELFAWLNSDDKMSLGTCQKWVAVFEKHSKIGLVTGGTYYIDSNGEYLYSYRWPLSSYIFLSSFSTLMMTQPSTCWRRQVYFELNGFNMNYRLSADRDFFLRAIKKYKIKRLNSILSEFRIHESNLSRVRREEAQSEDSKINQVLNVGSTSFGRKIVSFIGHFITKLYNPSMIFWKLNNGKGNLFR